MTAIHVASLSKLVAKLVELHYHHPVSTRAEGSSKGTLPDFGSSIGTWNVRDTRFISCLGQDDLVGRSLQAPSACGPRQLAYKRFDPYQAVPAWPLTRLRLPKSASTLLPVRLVTKTDGVCDSTGLGAILGIDLPDLEHGNFAYCVQTQTAYELVVTAQRERGLTSREKAMVADELYIH
jgi:hypothetical protein